MTGGNATLNRPWGGPRREKRAAKARIFVRKPAGTIAPKPRLANSLESFFFAETLKYLYLLFSEPSSVPFDLDTHVLTTEAHLLPILTPSAAAGGAHGGDGSCAAGEQCATTPEETVAPIFPPWWHNDGLLGSNE